MDTVTLDQVQLNFNPSGLAVINGIIGLAAQFVLLPAFTFLPVMILRPIASVALAANRACFLAYVGVVTP
jgi:hypothetical protein